MDLQQLQTLIKKDPAAYKEECFLHYRHFQHEIKIFETTPDFNSKKLQEQITFFSHVMSCYGNLLEEFPRHLMYLLEEKATVLHPELRAVVVNSFIRLRSKDAIPATESMPILFKLFKCKDKNLRQLVYGHIISDIKKIRRKPKSHQLNRSIQNFLHKLLQKGEQQNVSRKVIEILIELFRKHIWKDERTVNCIALGCFHEDSKTNVAALRFFLMAPNEENKEKEQESYQELKEKYKKLKRSSSYRGKTKKNEVLKEKALNLLKKKKEIKFTGANFPAIELLQDPHSFVEKLFGKLKHSHEKFEIKILMMNLISRVMGFHKCLLLNFFPFLLKYLSPHQQNVTYILAITAQAAHDLIPEEVILPVVKAIAMNFITERNTPEAVTIGINTIREICIRCPWAINETLLRDLVQYKKNRSRGISMAARSLVTLFRSLQPELLHKKDRGKFAQEQLNQKKYGSDNPVEKLEGMEMLDLDDYYRKKYGDDYLERIDEIDEFNEEFDEESFNADLASLPTLDDLGLELEDASDSDEDGEDDEAEGEEFDGEIEFDESETIELDDEEGEDEAEGEKEAQEGEAEEEGEGEEGTEVTEKADEGAKVAEEVEASEETADGEREEEGTQETAAEEAQEAMQGTEEKPEESVSNTPRLLAPEDFDRLKYLKTIGEINPEKFQHIFKNMKPELHGQHKLEDEQDEEENSEAEDETVIRPESLRAGMKKVRSTKEERVEKVLEGRKDRAKFGSKKAQKREEKNLPTLTSNRLKIKKGTRPIAMIRQSQRYRKKIFMSLKEKQKRDQKIAEVKRKMKEGGY